MKTPIILLIAFLQDELIHTTAFLSGQVTVPASYSPLLAALARQIFNAADYLKQHFDGIASCTDGRGHPAIGRNDVFRLFALCEKSRERGSD